MSSSASNFAFLKSHNDFLFSIAQAAEKNFPEDPNTTLVKLRIFGEYVANHLGQLLNIERQETQFKLLLEIQKKTNVDSTILDVFHTLRGIGNDAVHKYHNDLNDAEMCLRFAFRLAVWYYRLISKDKDFASPIFVLPTGQHDEEAQQQIARLKHTLLQAQAVGEQKEHKSQAEIKAQADKLIELEGQLAVLESKENETVSQSQARIRALESQLQQKEAQLAQLSEAERKVFHKQATTQANRHSLNLDEKETRYLIDEQLRQAGWEADTKDLKYSNGSRPQIGRNIAIAEWPTGKETNDAHHTSKGFADYVLFIGLTPVGVIEAKRHNIDVASKLNEAYRYSQTFDLLSYREELMKAAANDDVIMANVSELKISEYNATGFTIPFCFSANGRGYSAAIKTKSGIWYRDTRLTTNQPDALTQWFTPEELQHKLNQNIGMRNNWFSANPDMAELGLRYYQEDAVRAVEQAVLNGQRSALLAMATGTGKTRTAIAIMYRMVQSQRFKRVLFLVDRRSLGTQALNSFDEMRINNKTFTSIFNIKGMTERFPEDSTAIHVATVQSLVKRVLQSDEFIPVSLYDAIIIDEAHRGYILDKEQTEGEAAFRDQQDFISSYRRVIDQFDAFKLALTATPALHTTQIFGRPIFNYSYRTAVIDGYLNDYDPPIKIKTKLNTSGVAIAEGTEVERLSVSGELILDTLEDEQNFEVDSFNRQIILPSFNQVISKELTNYLDPTGQQKTLIFCVNNDHADMVVDALRDAFTEKFGPLQHDTIVKITGNADKNADKVQELITKFDKEKRPNIVVTVDLLTTGIDVRSICNLVFLRKVRSRILYEQMKGRATRLCPEVGKSNFRIFDAVDLYSSLEAYDTMKAVVVRPEVSLQILVAEISNDKTYDTLESNGKSFAQNSHEQLVSKLQRVITQAKYQRDRDKGIDQQVSRLDERLKNVARCDFASFAKTVLTDGPKVSAQYFAQMPNFVEQIDNLKRSLNALQDRPIFSDLPDEIIGTDTLYGQHNNADDFLDAFDYIVANNVNKLPALDAVINRPRDLTRKGLVELQEWFDANHFDESALQAAWKRKTTQDIAAKLVGHIRRAAIGNALLPFDVRVDHALDRIKSENEWNTAQLKWLDRLASSIKDKVVLDDDVYKIGNYRREGGKRRLEDALNGELGNILHKFSEYIWDELA